MLDILETEKSFILKHIKEGDTVADFTMGNGHDTLFFSKTVGESGRVYAFDIQPDALVSTKKRLVENNAFENYTLICDSHHNAKKYIDGKIKAGMFNLGYLPGGDHNICTQYTTTIEAIDKALGLINDTGFISVTIYYGKNSGTTEKENVLNYIKGLDHKLYTVTVHDFFNRPNNPPLTVVITKNK